ncbi:MAG TPA: leucine-rich repeat protein [Candidatus Levilactobacillus faecigallinarum]|uniref:Leucine-rich repeat protein n=1 Tax=Candidatus Levilactobacillus faecigallinarum TaxID=2838638 RepID=A0A9D1U4K3_9LACO|nr:leucine-rich repeat protein [Candidatus Levilactobacillus faecigallinarum]
MTKKRETKYWLAALTLATLSVSTTTITAKADVAVNTASDSSATSVKAATDDTTTTTLRTTTPTTGVGATTASDTETTTETAASTDETTDPATIDTGKDADSETPAGTATKGQTETTTGSQTSEAATESTGVTNPDLVQDVEEPGTKTTDATVSTEKDQADDANGNALIVPSPAKAPAAGRAVAEKASAVDYTDSSIFNWTTNDADTTATITGVNQQVSGTLNLPPTYTLNGKTYTVTTIGEAAFASATNLTNNLTGVIFNQGLQTISNSAFAYLNNLTMVDFSNANDLVSIGREAFVATGITSLDLPDSVTTIGQSAFTYSKISHVTLPASLTSLGETAFASNENLTSVDLSKATQLTSLSDHVFENDPLTSLTIPANIQTIGLNAFANNHNLTTLTFAPNSQLTSIGDGAFIYDVSLQTLNLPDSLVTLGQNAFLSNNALTQVTLGSGLTSIGDHAFTYDGNLKTVDFSRAASLQSIGTGAFEYAGISQNLTTPAGLKTIGDFAFAGNQLTGITLNDGLTQIGNGAFIYNHLTGALTIPGTVKQVGTQAFYGNELTAASFQAGTTLGQDALSYNQITSLTGPSVANAIAHEEMVTKFTDSENIRLNNLFTLNLGELTTDNLVISDITSADGTVSLQDGRFVVTAGTKRFTFKWSLPVDGQTTAYSGDYTVVLDDPNIKVKDTTIFTGTNWTPADNFVSAETDDGAAVDLSKLTISYDTDKPLNTNVAGSYKVTYSYGAESSVAIVIVKKRQVTLTLQGSQSLTYTGNAAVLDAKNYYVDLPDGSRVEFQAGDISYTATTNVGESVGVTLSQAGLDRLDGLALASQYEWEINDKAASYQITPAQITIRADNQEMVAGTTEPTYTATVTGLPADGAAVVYTIVREPGTAAGSYQISIQPGDNPNYQMTLQDGTLTIKPSKQSLTGTDYTMYVGDAKPTVADFQAQASDAYGNDLVVTADLTGIDYTTAGHHNVVLTTTDGQSKTVVLTIKANQQSLTGQDYTMYVGDPEATLADFAVTATDKTGKPQDVMVDFSGVNYDMAGNYAVKLMTADGLTETVMLHLLKNQQSLTGQDYTMYVGDPAATLADFGATATDKTGATQAVTADFSAVDDTTPGNYTVKLTTADGQTKMVTLHLLKNQQSLTGQDYTMYVGDPQPTVADFAATATDKTGTTQEVTADLKGVDYTTAGTYAVKLTTADGQQRTVTLTVKANQTQLTGKDYTMYVGDPTPDATDFQALATDKDGGAVQVTVDLHQAQLTQAGTYTVTLTAGKLTKTVTLTVRANQQTLVGNDYTMHLGDPEPTLTDFGATATDRDGHDQTVSLDLTTADLTTVGTYTVTLTTADGQRKQVQLHVLADPTDPENPTGPENPTDPETPTDPENPTDPETPTTPEEPSTPETPTVSGNGDEVGAGNQGVQPNQRPTGKPTQQVVVTGQHVTTSTPLQHGGNAATGRRQADATLASTATPRSITAVAVSNVPATTTTTTLPQTDEAPTTLWSVLGGLLGLLGVSGLMRRKRH